jgi:hypothetical protein
MSTQVLSGRGPILRTTLQRLRQAGYQTGLLKAVVPDWWSAESEDDPAAATQLKILLARQLGLDIEAVLERDAFEPETTPKGMQFKRSANLEGQAPSEETLAFCATLARTAASTIERSKKIQKSGDKIREAILSTGDAFVSLRALLRYCWSMNVAVMHVTEIPGKRKGMDAMVYRSNGRDIIVVTKAAKGYPAAWLSFLIAHELGHIALGHVSENGIYADDCEPQTGTNGDEAAANAFAADVLAGSNVQPFWETYAHSPRALVNSAISDGERFGIDPGHIILRWANDFGRFPLALKAWKTRKAKPKQIEHDAINETALEKLDVGPLSESMGEFLRNVLRLVTA